MPVIVQRLNYPAHNHPNNTTISSHSSNELHPRTASRGRVSFNRENTANTTNLENSNLNEPSHLKHGECESMVLNIENNAIEKTNDDLSDIDTNRNRINNNNNKRNIKPDKSSSPNKLNKRKRLFEKRRHLSDWSSFFALAGIFLMILETELTLSNRFDKSSSVSVGLKACITLSSIVLVALVVAYHRIQIRLFMVDNCIDDWLIAMNRQRVLKIVIEVVICLTHPIPGDFKVLQTIRIPGQEPIKTLIPIDIFLSLIMFLRLYLLGRSMLLHSTIFTNVSSRSIGALNRIDFNMRFVVKTLMTMYPGLVLVVFSLSIFVISSWTLRLCESYHDERFGNLLTAMWAIAVTFLTIGYGDIVPVTYCGRSICIISGFMGVACTAIMIAVFAQKLQLSRSEEYVHNFITENKLKKRLKNEAAKVIQQTWLVYKYRKLRPDISKYRSHQRRLLKAIDILKHVKLEQKDLRDESRVFIDLSNSQKESYEIVCSVSKNQANVEERIKELENKITSLQQKLDSCTLDLFTILEQIRLIVKKFESLPRSLEDSEDRTINSSGSIDDPDQRVINRL